MELDKNYDIIVVGSNLSAYISTALAAKRGLDVLLVDSKVPKHSFECGGFSFDIVPQYSAGFYPEKLFDKIFKELNLSLSEKFDIRKISDTYQVISPTFRVNITDHYSHFKQEISREFPNNVDSILEFYKTILKYYEVMDSLLEKELLLPPSTIKEKREYSKLLHSYAYSDLKKFSSLDDILSNFDLKNTPFEKFVKAQISLFSYTYSDNPSFIQTVRILGNMMKRVSYINGGYQKLIDILKKKIIHFGGEIKSGVPLDELIYEGRKLVGIRLSSFEGIIYSKYIISSQEVNDFINLMGKRIKRRHHMRSKTLLKQYALYTINIGVDESVIPVGMTDRFAYIVNEDKPLLNENLILCNISHKKDNIKAPEGKRVISASCIVPHRLIRKSSPELIRIKDRVIYNLKKVIPFLEDHVMAIYPKESKYFPKLGGAYISEEPNAAPVFIYSRIGKPFLGISAISNRTQEKNLFFTGREVMPDIGFEGEIHSCHKVVNHIEKRIIEEQNKKPLFS